VYLHGFASGPSSAKAVFLKAKLAEREVDLFVPDLNEGDFAGLTVTRILAHLARLLAGARRVILFGSSLGGYAAALHAARDPERVVAAVVLAPAFGFGRRFLERLPPEVRAAGELEVYHYATGQPAHIKTAIFEDALRYPEEPDVRCPVLDIHGRFDESVPVAISEAFAAKRPNVRLVILEDDHQIKTRASLDAIWRETESFLAPWLPPPPRPAP
jgi:hypothetical protein